MTYNKKGLIFHRNRTDTFTVNYLFCVIIDLMQFIRGSFLTVNLQIKPVHLSMLMSWLCMPGSGISGYVIGREIPPKKNFLLQKIGQSFPMGACRNDPVAKKPLPECHQ